VKIKEGEAHSIQFYSSFESSTDEGQRLNSHD